MGRNAEFPQIINISQLPKSSVSYSTQNSLLPAPNIQHKGFLQLLMNIYIFIHSLPYLPPTEISKLNSR